MGMALNNNEFVADVSATADLPFRVTVWTEYDQLRVISEHNTLLASMPIARAAMLGRKEAAGRLGRMARAAYDSDIRPARSA
jgi:hypothetical protein